MAVELLRELEGARVVLCGRGAGAEPEWLPVLSGSVLPWQALRVLRSHDPDRLLLVPNGGLTYLLLLRLLLIHLVVPAARIRLVVLQRPRTPPRWLWAPVRARLTAIAANEADRDVLAGLGLRAELLDVRAPTDRVSALGQADARALVGLPGDEIVFLHVGHATHGRNLRALEPLADLGVLMLVLSPYSEMDETTLPDHPGVRIVHEQVPVGDYYRAADVYVFPTVSMTSAIGLPMSIVEAIANGVPVVARSSALTERWSGHYLVTLIDSDEELVAVAHEVGRRRAPA